MDDLISRQDALDALEWTWAGKKAIDAIKNMPSADRLTGHWIHEEMASSSFLDGSFKLQTCKCSECGLYMEQECNYCPNCGADMREREGE